MPATETAQTTFRILAADKLAEEGLEYIRSQPDAELINEPGLDDDRLKEMIGEHDGMIVRSGVTVTAETLSQPGRLKAIARAGVGVDNIDLAAATARGILVMNTAAASTISTAEHAFALMMALSRNIGPACRKMHEGGWDRSQYVGHQLSGHTLGVVGFGRIGQTVAERALAFGMKVVGYDPLYAESTALDGKVVMFREFEKMLPEADYLTFHVPLNNDTRGMLNDQTFDLCRPGVKVINASRGGVVDEDALLKAVDDGRCGGAALDVYSHEPPPADSPLRRHDKILTTPHLGASTHEAQQAVSVDAARSLLDYLRGKGIAGAVNVRGLQVDLDPLQTAFVDLADRMARLISPMITGPVDSVTIELSGDRLSRAAGTLERHVLIGLLQSHLDLPLNVINVRHVAEERGITLRTVTVDDEKAGGNRLTIEVGGSDEVRRAVGRVYDDYRPRVIEINGYHMDMVPAGPVILLQNEDRPGMVGLV
ncbi:MAG: phosphoglycerate dehydrogenase, partial [Phycisphaeraceae bacterium]|nr:phosphoglycerate dehydrogenase [Phycisphaeraceae bacterium]